MVKTPPELPSLSELCLAALARNISRERSLEGLPEDLVLELFEEVLLQGRLTPHVLRVFERTGHEPLLQRIAALRIRSLPPVLPITHNRWLGY